MKGGEGDDVLGEPTMKVEIAYLFWMLPLCEANKVVMSSALIMSILGQK